MLINKLITSEGEILNIVAENFYNKEKLLITYINQHCFNLYMTNKDYRELLDNSFTVYPDGSGMHLAINILLGRKYKSFNATDLNENILNYFVRNSLSFYIIGGNFDKTSLTRFSETKIFLGYWNGYIDENEYADLVHEVNQKNPEIIIIGMGAPKQELFAYKLSKSTNAAIYLCVGNFFEFYLGTVKRIPVKYRNSGIEWLYRIKQEPKRLWKRYLIGIPLFIFRVIKFKFTNTKTG